MSIDQHKPLGILAGGGQLPLEVARSIAARDRPVHIVAIEGEADPAIATFSHTWVNWGGIGAMVQSLRDADCAEMVIVGSVRRPNLSRIRPDLGFFFALPELIGLLKGGDDSVLRRVVHMFERRGLVVRGVRDVAPELVATEDLVTNERIGQPEDAAIRLGAHALAEMAPFDLGQAVVAGPTAILDIEGAEGTDAMLQRLVDTGAVSGDRAQAVLIKTPKAGQEIRVDMPTIGPTTIALARQAGLAGVAVARRAVLIADKAKTVDEARTAGLFLISRDFNTGQSQSKEKLGANISITKLTPSHISQRHIRDAHFGAALLAALRPFWGDGAVAVSREYPLAVEHACNADRALTRASRNKPWGLTALQRRTGVLVLDWSETVALEAIASQVAKAGFAGLVLSSVRHTGAIQAAAAIGQNHNISLMIVNDDDAN